MNDVPTAPYPLLVPLFENFPAQLVNAPQWVVWKGEWLPEKGKYNKIPFDAKTGKKASSTDPATWATFEQAKRCYQRGRGNFAGVGFVLSAEDAFAGVDLDSDCPQEKTDAWVALLDSYTEVSPSGKGLRVFVLAKLPPGDRKRGPVECYQEGRFLTVTGHVVEGTPVTIEERQLQVECFHLEAFPVKDKPSPTPPLRSVCGFGLLVSDSDLISKACQAKNGGVFSALYSGDMTGYGSQSEADLALCNRLVFWTGPDPARLDRLFRDSGLYRDKWNESHHAGGETYGEHTIAKAIAGCSVFYSPVISRNGHEPKARKPEDRKEQSDSEEVYPIDESIALPFIIVSGRQDRHIAEDCWKALHASNTPPILFARGVNMVRLRRDTGTNRIVVEMTEEQRILHRMRRIASFISLRTVKNKETGESKTTETSVTPPPRIAKDMLVDPEEICKLPVIRTIVHVPQVSSSGQMVWKPGYHAGESVFLDTEGLPEPPKTATKADAIAALDRLFGLDTGVFGQFPFANPTDKAHAIALLLTPLLRLYIAGSAPMCLVEAPERSSGKTLMAVNLLRVSDPEPSQIDAPSSRDPKDAEAEWTKVLATALKDGPSVLYLDNLRGALASQSLESFLTNTGEWSARLLGTNNKVTAWPSLITIVGSSNNTEASRDMARRCYIVRLDANTERPEDRTGFRIVDIDNYVKEHRGEILADVLTLLVAWIGAGRPEGRAVKGSFQRWASVLSGILDFLGVPGFLEGEDVRSTALDPEKVRWTAFVTAWWERFGKGDMTAKELVEIAVENDVVSEDAKSKSRSLGKMLMSNRDRIFAGFRFIFASGHGNLTYWSLKESKKTDSLDSLDSLATGDTWNEKTSGNANNIQYGDIYALGNGSHETIQTIQTNQNIFPVDIVEAGILAEQELDEYEYGDV